MKRVLIVEDDQDISDLLKVNLSDIDLECDVCARGDQAMNHIVSNDYALVILDLTLPGKSGLEICKEVRQTKPLQPILMLTAKSSELDQIIGLEVGADDYMTKPFSIPSLQARVRTRINRSQFYIEQKAGGNTLSENLPLTVGALSIDQSKRLATFAGQSLDLTALEFDLISFFATNPEKVYSRTQLLDQVWGYNHDGYEHTVNSNINRLRSKLPTPSRGKPIIQTVWGVGYRFNPAGCQIS